MMKPQNNREHAERGLEYEDELREYDFMAYMK